MLEKLKLEEAMRLRLAFDATCGGNEDVAKLAGLSGCMIVCLTGWPTEIIVVKNVPAQYVGKEKWFERETGVAYDDTKILEMLEKWIVGGGDVKVDREDLRNLITWVPSDGSPSAEIVNALNKEMKYSETILVSKGTLRALIWFVPNDGSGSAALINELNKKYEL